MRSHSSVVSAMGFSTKTWQPISSASSVSAQWDAGGVRICTTCGRVLAISARDGKTPAIPNRAAKSSAFFRSTSQIPTTSTNGRLRNAAKWREAT